MQQRIEAIQNRCVRRNQRGRCLHQNRQSSSSPSLPQESVHDSCKLMLQLSWLDLANPRRRCQKLMDSAPTWTPPEKIGSNLATMEGFRDSLRCNDGAAFRLDNAAPRLQPQARKFGAGCRRSVRVPGSTGLCSTFFTWSRT